MSTKSKALMMALGAAAMMDSPLSTIDRTGVFSKDPLTVKQLKLRAASKRARKARKISRPTY